jgi:hypothetical protein
MKIGILTYHYGYNFGGVLQCYALQQTLKEIGYHDVHVINCIPSRLKFYLGGIPRKRSLSTICNWYLRIRYGTRCKKAFDAFREKYLNQTEYIKRNFLPQSVKSYDALIVGSDQIWNFREQSNGQFFLNWEPQFEGRKIAYAPCCGKNEVNEKCRGQLEKALNDFDFLSVRNSETLSFVEGIIGKSLQIVPDPTCLYDFKNLLTSIRLVKANYIFAYILGDDINGGNVNAISILKKKYPNRKVIASIIAYSNPRKITWADEIKYDLSPIDWLNMIQNADFVYTDSFHGTIFSMRFNVPFITYYVEERRKARFLELQTQFDISENIVSSLEQIKSFEPRERNFDKKFSDLSNLGRNYLREALK